MRLLLCLLIVNCPFAWAQKKTVFVITDAEGVGGVCRQDQTEPKDQELRQLLTGEVNAAVEGFLAGGADEVVVWDGHDGSQTLSTLTIHPKAKLVMGVLGASMMMDRRFSAVAYVGQHSKANVRGGIMAHSYSSLGIQSMLLNGKPVGEIDVIAAMAGQFGTPVIMLSGDQAAANELHEIVPDAEFAVVKEGVGRYTCVSLSASAARDAIREASRRSVSKIGSIKPYTVAGPVTLQVEYTTRNSLPIDAEVRAGAEVLDDRTIRFKGLDAVDTAERDRIAFRANPFILGFIYESVFVLWTKRCPFEEWHSGYVIMAPPEFVQLQVLNVPGPYALVRLKSTDKVLPPKRNANTTRSI